VILLLASIAWVVLAYASETVMGSEFYPQWFSARGLAFGEENPYISTIQVASFYPDEARGLIPEQLNTPIYSLFLILPFALIDNFTTSFTIWLLFELVCVGLLLRSTLRLIEWKIQWLIAIVIGAYLGFSFNSFQALASGSLIIPTSLFLVLSILALKTERNELAGFLLALTSILPHYFFLVYLLAILWGISVRRWSFILWFFASIFILSIIGTFIIPGWLVDYARILWGFNQNFTLWSPGEILTNWLPGIGTQVGWGLTLLTGVYLLVEWVAVRGKDVQWYFWTTCMTIAASQIVGIPVNPAEQFILVVPFLLILSVWVQRTAKLGKRIMIISVIGLIAIPWYIAIREGLIQVFIRPGASLFFLLPLVTLVGIFWVRWWAIRPLYLYIEELRSIG